MTTNITLGDRKIGQNEEPFIIAEMSGNHNGSLERAKQMVKAAAETGVDCLKFQTFTADTLTLNSRASDFVINDEKSLWNGRQLYELYKEAHTPWDWHAELFEAASKLGVMSFSTPFDETAVSFLNDLGVPMFKIASFEITHLPLIRKVAQTGKPIIMSTGLASIEEIAKAIETARAEGNDQIVILKCTSAYPANAADANLATIPDMRERFGVQVGLSDHTLGAGVAVASIVLGSTVVEKHFTLDRSEGGVDADFSLEPWEMKLLKEETTRAWHALGEVKYDGTANETKSLQFRQSIWPNRDIAEGENLTKDNLKICRPGLSLDPKYYKSLLSQTAKRPIKMGERIKLNDL